MDVGIPVRLCILVLERKKFPWQLARACMVYDPGMSWLDREIPGRDIIGAIQNLCAVTDLFFRPVA